MNTTEKCSVCGSPIDEDAINAAMACWPTTIARDEVEAYHLDCALSDGSYIKESEVTDEDRAHGVYLIEKI
jgi:hypothetical protein